MKILKKSHIEAKKQEAHIITERNVLAEIEHPFITQLYYSFQSEKKLFFVMEYCPGGELFYLLSKQKKFTEEQYSYSALGPSSTRRKWCWLWKYFIATM